MDESEEEEFHTKPIMEGINHLLEHREYFDMLIDLENDEDFDLNSCSTEIINPKAGNIYLVKKLKINCKKDDFKSSDEFYKAKINELKKIDCNYKFKQNDSRILHDIKDDQGSICKEMCGLMNKTTSLIGTHSINGKDKAAVYVSNLRKFTFTLKTTMKLLVIVHYIGR